MDEPSILQLKLVSKSATEQVSNLISSRKAKVWRFFVRAGSEDNTTVLSFYLTRSERDYFSWKLAFIPAFNKLQLGTSSYSKPYCGICVTLVQENVRKFLSQLKLLIHRAHFDNVAIHIYDLYQPDIIDICLDFLEGKTIRRVTVENYLIDFVPRIILKMRAGEASFFIRELTQDFAKFLYEFAEIVNTMCIFVRDSSDISLISISQRILTKNCKALQINHYNGPISVGEVEKLLKFFSHLNLKVIFHARFALDSTVRASVGEYLVQTTGFGIKIRHFGKDDCFSF